MVDRYAAWIVSQPRSIVDVKEWGWMEQHTRGEFDHLLLGTPLPAMSGAVIGIWRPGVRQYVTALGVGAQSSRRKDSDRRLI
ncbi:MAG: hypothetical protein M3120_06065 [Pseudomonadota bacterium]|nr:hypothetical protein [Pseudomonadota bacterium]